MAKRKRKTLPKDFGDMLEKASFDDLVAVFDACELEATGGYGKQTALGDYRCPDALARWLVAQGADIDARDTYKRTPLHARASSWIGGVDALLDLGADIAARDYTGATPLHAAAHGHKPDGVRALVARGADIAARDDGGRTPLEVALATASNIDIAATADIATQLIAAGARPDAAMRARVRQIGETFEFHRTGFNPDYLGETEAGLDTLYRLFDVTPVAPRRTHDGVSPIVLPDGDWATQYEAAWTLLVPSRGAAATVQGEVVRIGGRVADEILRNGGANWDAGFRAMCDALPVHLGSGSALDDGDLAEARTLAASLRRGDDDGEGLDRIRELAVRWVARNPQPLALPKPAYDR